MGHKMNGLLRPSLVATVISSVIASSAITANAASLNEVQSQNPWFTSGQQLIAEKIAQQPNTNKAKNVILFVGDGMGISTLTAARILQGQNNGAEGEENFLSFEQFPHTALVKTYNTNQQTPDSAGTMTAMMTGVKNKAGVISLGANAVRGDCNSSKGNELVTSLMLAENLGKATGIVSTARITHATPAATYAHSPERNWESDNNMPAEAISSGCKDIATQLVEFPYGDGIDVALGGGKRHFIPKQDGGKRTDNRNLISQWQTRFPQGQLANNSQELMAIDAKETTKLLGLFNSSHMNYEADRDSTGTGEPSLADMTTKAIDVLANNDKGFFLMVEAGRIDHGHHAGNAYRALTDAVAFSDAIKAATENNKINLDETLIVVTADHSHVFTIAGYPTKGNPILGHVVSNDATGSSTGTPSLASDNLPYTTLGYNNGLGFADLSVGGDTRYNEAPTTGRQDTTNINTQGQGYHQEALIPLESETHAGEDISLHAQGPSAHLFQGVIEQSTLFHIINHAAQLDAKAY
ncbi:alkaline phosphatase [Motilimonas cestriensis]|uniref:Alkaline phosphatase n=1 Tax=Motilimonas cestriensis TaxID=2742685 RepID=A0ABS8WI39_9GAMM|nr:alkaline phosphatase [Motilimonas cestriensis]MCE2597035.1 alkaline phosphatase [Motilimonas cestriensis]